MDIDESENLENGSQTTITKGLNQVLHVRQDSASELEALFNTVMNPNYKTKSLPMKARNLPKSFFVQPDKPRHSPHYHHGHSQSMGGISSTPMQVNHSRSSSSDSNTSHTSVTGIATNTNNSNGSTVGSPGIPSGNSINGNLNNKFPLSPVQRQVRQQFHRSHSLQMPQVVHSRSKSSPASLQLMDVANLQVKVSDIPPDMPLPHGWSAAKTPDGQHYFMNHNNQSTTWEDPRLAILKQQHQSQLVALQTLPPPSSHPQSSMIPSNLQADIAMQPLPAEWEQASTPQGEIYFINHQTRTTSWIDPRLQNLPTTSGNQQNNNSQLQQQLMKVSQMEQNRNTSMLPQKQSMLKHLVQEKEMLRRQIMKQQMNNNGMDPFLGANGSSFHQRDASLDSGVGMGSNYSLPRTPEDYLGNMEEMDTGDSNRRVLNNPQQPQSHLVPTNSQQHSSNNSNNLRFPDFLDNLPTSNVDFATGIVANAPGQTSVPGIDGGDLVPCLQDTDFDVESMLNNVKTENVDNNMTWI